jgi:ribonucleoside-diphosphate reductase alpha chain
MTKDKGIELLSATVVYNKYAKYNTALQRRETWEEIVDRYVAMMVKKYPKLENAILENASYIYDKKVLMSMRAAQFSGAAVEKNETRGYNCSFMPMDHYKAFSETMFLLLSGCGVGYSVQARHISQLPAIKKPTDKKKFLIGDSIEGWADAVKALMKAYMGITKYRPKFDYSDIREKGARLVTAGGKAPGPDPLRISLTKIESILYNKEDGTQLTDFEVHLINCIIADAVLAGGIRRAAMISLFDKDSKKRI